jgi:hypothetical protein
VNLPKARVETVEIEPAPEEDEKLLRYLVYLGAGYLEAERLVAEAGEPAQAYAELHRLLGAVQGEESVLRFHYFEAARGFAEESRAQAAHERMAGAYEALIEKMEGEIALREERVRRLAEALGG